MFTIAYPEILKVSKLAQDASRIFDFWPGLPATASHSPAIDLREDKEGLEIRVYLPGVEAKDLSITAEAGWLKVEGGKAEPEGSADGEEEAGYILREGLTGPFLREIKLPDWADSEQAKATLALGVLSLRIPRKEESKPRNIGINVA